ncbi:hypothetical protein NEUTE1DRAFT_145959 [Neurospora tetrasperma FGSC 2508]|uniref:Uncharacterized protein n=1 Tax=Neurospora tetrasperma (strain FGSC 2508 / ATCC MYA-4615 / P0657) TaxID=510951 RepID=F8MJQ2_NEUT8|nr:uncharacterized protein NEUTE1DRAFT_145959 [Neurospora tetrasperma FGSC 2508]EGO57293.1 hypothetical protein NEUTE1DRAFT_145959 [Neurospora tetrasperma FGSC 2508]EGZ72455.1 hypothetical protein NEUTE2DRAFT_112081 [Neurospora tetrasperma FGSC 2509]
MRTTNNLLGHFKKGYGRRNGTPIDRERAIEQNQYIGRALNHVVYVTCVLDGVESLWQYLEAMAIEIPPSAKTEQVIQSTNNILEAIRFLRQEVKSMRAALRENEARVRDQALLLSSHLSQTDSETNIEIAHASRDFAAAAQRDSSAMKSIAILTMSSLSGMFFAALFAMPYFGSWDQPRHFVLYWACTIPTTILTFAIWAALTQRSVVVRWMKMLCSNWPWGFWQGRRRKGCVFEGNEEKGEKVV